MNLKIQFEPYVIEPFEDWYVFPSAVEGYKDLLYRDYREDLADLQYDYVQKLRDAQQWQQQRIADRNLDFQKKLAELK